MHNIGIAKSLTRRMSNEHVISSIIWWRSFQNANFIG